MYSTITFNWNDAKKTLIVDSRQGSYPGMLTNRKFSVVLVTENKGTGMQEVKAYDKVVDYTGKKTVVKL